MKKNRSIFIVFILLALIALGLWLTQSSTTFRRSLSDFKLLDSSNVTRIFIADKNNNMVTLARVSPGKWTVNEVFPAQNQSINLLLKTMVELEVQQPVANAAHDNIVKELAVNAVKVEIYQQVYRIDLFGFIRWFSHEKLTKVYYVGGATQNNLGSFMLMQGSSEPFIVFLPGFRGFVSPRYSPIEKYWRDYNVFRKTIPEIAKVRVEIPANPGYSYEVKNNGNNKFVMLSLKDNLEVPDYDTLKLLNFLSGFRNLNYEALLNDMDKVRKDSILRSQPFIIITLTDTAGVSKTITTYHKKGPEGQVDPTGIPLPYDLDRLYASVNDGKDFTIIQYFTFDKVLRPKPFFIKDGGSAK
ncbi:MAG: hypothetical protein ACOYNC_00515 [Bacteroidales bacterium]